MPPAVHRLVPAAALAAGLAAGGPPRAPIPTPRPLLGFAVNAHHIGDLSLYLDAVDAIAELGANGLVVVTPMFQDRADSDEIRFLPDRCPTDAQLVAILRRARRRGLHTTLLPIVLLQHPGDDDWRGVIRPADPDAWWASYGRVVDRFVGVALAADVDALSVGSELNSMEREVRRWDGLITRVRERFGGALTYTANWDRYREVPFWSQLDFIGVSAYFELAPGNPQAPVERLADAWRAERRRLLAFAAARDRPLVLMELGYPSLPWAAARPWDYVPQGDVRADHDAQARCFRAFFDAWSPAFTSAGPALGVHCYAWDPYRHGEPTDTGYGVAGKPALDVIRDAFARIRRRAPAAAD
jgi:hypothetical protein